MKKMKKLLMLMAVAVTSFTFTACDDDPWMMIIGMMITTGMMTIIMVVGDGTREAGTKVHRGRKTNGCLRKLRLW